MSEFINVILDYFRIASYGVVVLCSVFGLKRTVLNKFILVGNAIFFLAAILVVLAQRLLKMDAFLSADLILSPAVLFLAIINLYAFYKK